MGRIFRPLASQEARPISQFAPAPGSNMKTFFGRLALPILLVVFFLVPFSLRGARSAVKNMKNEISEWLPKSFQESSEMGWFWQHFMGERFIIISWPGCTGEDDDQSYKLLVDKLAVE